MSIAPFQTIFLIDPDSVTPTSISEEPTGAACTDFSVAEFLESAGSVNLLSWENTNS